MNNSKRTTNYSFFPLMEFQIHRDLCLLQQNAFAYVYSLLILLGNFVACFDLRRVNTGAHHCLPQAQMQGLSVNKSELNSIIDL